jgi:hypothetical protein
MPDEALVPIDQLIVTVRGQRAILSVAPFQSSAIFPLVRFPGPWQNGRGKSIDRAGGLWDNSLS